MLRNYIKIAFRNIQNHTSYSFINIFGLSVGLAAAIVISLYAVNILKFDHHHRLKDRIYLSYKERITPDGTQATYDTWVPLGPRLEADFSNVETTSRHIITEGLVKRKDQFLNEELTLSETSLFDIFTIEIIDSSHDEPLPNLNSVAISETIVTKYFSDKDPLREELEIFLTSEDTTIRYFVSAIFKDLPLNSSIRPEIILPIESARTFENYENDWGNSFLSTWVLLDDPKSLLNLEAGFPDLISNIWDPETQNRTTFKLLPLVDYYDTIIGDTQDAWIMLFIAVGILIIASINFMNLATARSSYRSREIGLRKVLGAVILQLRTQFLVEAIIYTLISMTIGIVIVFFGLPYLNQYFDLNLQISSLLTINGLLSLLIITLAIGIFSGSYPAFYLSTVGIIQVLRKAGITGGARSFRNGLIVVQFALAVLLICSSLMVKDQLHFMYNKDMGFNENQLVFIEASAEDFLDGETGAIRINTFKKNLSNYSFVSEISASRGIPTNWTQSFLFVRPKGWTGDPLRMRYTYVDANFFPTFDIPFTTGQNFLPDIEGHQRNSAVLNEAAYKALNLDTTTYPQITIGSFDINVVGVVKDFNFETMRNEIEPTIHFHRTADHPVHNYLAVRLNTKDLERSINEMENEWSKLGSIAPFRFRFADGAVQQMYENEKQFLALITFFTIISILIACLGLYGLTVFVIEKKRKEISIRKIVGAKLSEIASLVVKEFAPWVLVSLLLGGFVSFQIFSEWLVNFHYRAPIDFMVFIVTGLLVVLLVLVTIGYQTVKAFIANPVKYLRED